MGIKGLAKLLSDEAPDSIREIPLSSLHGRKIAIDASMAIYQFLIAIRAGSGAAGAAVQLTNAQGETTSHIQGMFNRTIRFLTEGIRPAFVFDGRPPSLKSGELRKRRERRIKAESELQTAREEGNVDEQEKQEKRLVRAGQRENDDCQRLLRLMGMPVLVAPCEAEAQAAALCQAGTVYATATEDMDALTFRTPVLVRKLTFANASKSMLQSINYQKALDGLEVSYDEFVDLCILLGCDYCDSIRGVGPKTALKLIRQYHNIETILEHIDGESKYKIPDDWHPPSYKKRKTEQDYATDDDDKDIEPKQQAKEDDKTDADEGGQQKGEQDKDDEPVYVQARRLFHEHEVDTSVKLTWSPCQADELTAFLVDECGFNPDRVKSSIEKLQKAYKATSKPQSRMDSFFQVKAKPTSAASTKKKQKAKEAAAGKKKSAPKRKR